jgi:hypothetical protein
MVGELMHPFHISVIDSGLFIEIHSSFSLIEDLGIGFLRQLDTMSQDQKWVIIHARSQLSDQSVSFQSEIATRATVDKMLLRADEGRRIISRLFNEKKLLWFSYDRDLFGSWCDLAFCFERLIATKANGVLGFPEVSQKRLPFYGFYTVSPYGHAMLNRSFIQQAFANRDSFGKQEIEALIEGYDAVTPQFAMAQMNRVETKSDKLSHRKIQTAGVAESKKFRLSLRRRASSPEAPMIVEGEIETVLRYLINQMGLHTEEQLRMLDYRAASSLFIPGAQEALQPRIVASLPSGNRRSAVRILIDDPPPHPRLAASFVNAEIPIVALATDSEMLRNGLELISEDFSNRYGPQNGRERFRDWVYWTHVSQKEINHPAKTIYELDVFGFLVEHRSKTRETHFLIDYALGAGDKFVVETIASEDSKSSDIQNLPFAALQWRTKGLGLDLMPISVWIRCMCFDELLRMHRLRGIELGQVIGELRQEGWSFLGDETAVETFSNLRLQYLGAAPEEYALAGVAPEKRFWRLDTWLDQGAAAATEDRLEFSSEYTSWRMAIFVATCAEAVNRSGRVWDHQKTYSILGEITGMPKRYGVISEFGQRLGVRRLRNYAQKFWGDLFVHLF